MSLNDSHPLTWNGSYLLTINGSYQLTLNCSCPLTLNDCSPLSLIKALKNDSRLQRYKIKIAHKKTQKRNEWGGEGKCSWVNVNGGNCPGGNYPENKGPVWKCSGGKCLCREMSGGVNDRRVTAKNCCKSLHLRSL